jgi:hypothetical protein
MVPPVAKITTVGLSAEKPLTLNKILKVRAKNHFTLIIIPPLNYL